jgi:hypothetical protein
VMQHMGDIEGCANGHDRLRLWHAMCCGQHSGPAQRMADDNGRRSIVLPQMIRSADQILDIRRKVGVLELPRGGAEPCDTVSG